MADRGLTITLPGARAEQDKDGRWFVKLTPADVQGAISPEDYDYFNARPENEVQVEVRLIDSPVPDGEVLHLAMPDQAAGYGLRPHPDMGTVVLKRPDAPALDVARAIMAGTGGSSVIPGVVTEAMRGGKVGVNARTLRPPFGKLGDNAPALSDELMFSKSANGVIPRKAFEPITAALRSSRAFVFDRAASYRVGEICAYMPDLIADQMEFARVPYPKTWIELDGDAVLDAMRDAGLRVYDGDPDTRDERLGFLYTDRGIYTAAGSAAEEACFSPIAYRPHAPMRAEQEERFCAELGCSRIQIDQFMWGNAYDMLDPSRRRAMRYQHGIDFLLPAGWNSTGEPGPLRGLLQGGGAGDLKVALCAALLLIRPNMTVVIDERAPGRKMVHGRPTTFLAHRVVTVKLSPDRLVSRIKRACKEERGRAAARWHEVRGHYMHNHKAKTNGCVHDWEQVEPDRWECRKGCGGKRAWRTYPEGRGDASIGVVTKHYDVRP